MNRMNYQGATAVVTGGARGIGRSIATEFARRGSNVVVVDLNAGVAAATAADLRALGVKSEGHGLDVTDASGMVELARHVQTSFGPVDLLVNNAGVTMRPYRAIWEASIDDYRWMLDVNFMGVVHGVLAFVPQMRAAGGRRHIVNTSSVATISRNTGHAMYGASKAAVDALSDTLREELIDHGDDIGVTILYPGYVTTTIAETSESSRSAENNSAGRDVVAYPHLDKKTAESFHSPLAPERVGAMVLRAIDSNAPYCTTHQMDSGFFDARTRNVLAGHFPEN